MNENRTLFLQQAKALIESETDFIANLANISSLLKEFYQEKCSWAGFYLFKDEMLVLGPFQGKPACTRIQLGKGVCGTAAKTRKTQIVPDVHQFEGHIACDGGSNSEIVVNVIQHDTVVAVIDLDSYQFNTFTQEDADMLEALAELVKELF